MMHELTLASVQAGHDRLGHGERREPRDDDATAVGARQPVLQLLAPVREVGEHGGQGRAQGGSVAPTIGTGRQIARHGLPVADQFGRRHARQKPLRQLIALAPDVGGQRGDDAVVPA
jgi:hypothetical protein